MSAGRGSCLFFPFILHRVSIDTQQCNLISLLRSHIISIKNLLFPTTSSALVSQSPYPYFLFHLYSDLLAYDSNHTSILTFCYDMTDTDPTSSSALPCTGEVIHVCFMNDDNKTVWWKATVDYIQQVGDTTNVIATARLVYSAAHGYDQDIVDVHFLPNHFFQSTSDRSVSAWIPDKYKDRMGKDDDFNPSRSVKRSNATESFTHRKARRRSSRRTTRNENEDHHVPATKSSLQDPAVHFSAENDIHRRLCALESRVSTVTKCDHAIVTISIVSEIFDEARINLLLGTQRPIRKFSGQISGEKFDGILRRSSLEWSMPCAYTRFTYMFRSIIACDFYRNSQVSSIPSPSRILDPSSRFDKIQVIFQTATAFF